MNHFDVFVIGTGTASGSATAILQETGLKIGVAGLEPLGGDLRAAGMPRVYPTFSSDIKYMAG